MIRRVSIEGREVVLDGYGGDNAERSVRLDGELLGEVRAFATHLNLRRPLTVRGWRAFPAGGQPRRLPEGTDLSCFDTRADAVGVLVKRAAERPIRKV